MEVVFSNLALESLASIAIYVGNIFGSTVSDKALRRIVAFIRSLGTMPRMGMIAKEFSMYGEVRRAIYKQNRIYYLIANDVITIIIVWDGRQDPRRVKSLVRQYLENIS